MTNSQVLYSATVAPSNWMKKTIQEKIKVGYNADLVLLSKPIEDI
jgi:predicted amidohydrolase